MSNFKYVSVVQLMTESYNTLIILNYNVCDTEHQH